MNAARKGTSAISREAENMKHSICKQLSQQELLLLVPCPNTFATRALKMCASITLFLKERLAFLVEHPRVDRHAVLVWAILAAAFLMICSPTSLAILVCTCQVGRSCLHSSTECFVDYNHEALPTKCAIVFLARLAYTQRLMFTVCVKKIYSVLTTPSARIAHLVIA